MKVLPTSLALIVTINFAFAQTRNTSPGAVQADGQNRTIYPRSSPAANPAINPGPPAQSTYPGAGAPYSGTSSTYPGTGTQPGFTVPGTGTAPRTGALSTTPFRTYSDKNNLINNSPNMSPAAPGPATFERR